MDANKRCCTFIHTCYNYCSFCLFFEISSSFALDCLASADGCGYRGVLHLVQSCKDGRVSRIRDDGEVLFEEDYIFLISIFAI